jgi:hypothetical protein
MLGLRCDSFAERQLISLPLAVFTSLLQCCEKYCLVFTLNVHINFISFLLVWKLTT